MKLTEKQKVFADEYIISLNATEAAIKAGYSENSARQIGYENLTKPYIVEYIQERLEKKEEERIATQDEVLEYLTRVMRAEEEEQLVKVTKDGEVIELAVLPGMRDRNKAAELLGRRYGTWKDRLEVTSDTKLEDFFD